MRMEPDGPWRVTGSNAPMEADYAQRVLEQTGDIAAAAGGHFGNSPAVGTALDSCRFLRKPTTSKVTRSLNALLEAAERSILSALSSLDEVDAAADNNYDALWEIACSKQSRLSQTEEGPLITQVSNESLAVSFLLSDSVLWSICFAQTQAFTRSLHHLHHCRLPRLSNNVGLSRLSRRACLMDSGSNHKNVDAAAI